LKSKQTYAYLNYKEISYGCNFPSHIKALTCNGHMNSLCTAPILLLIFR